MQGSKCKCDVTFGQHSLQNKQSKTSNTAPCKPRLQLPPPPQLLGGTTSQAMHAHRRTSRLLPSHFQLCVVPEWPCLYLHAQILRPFGCS